MQDCGSLESMGENVVEFFNAEGYKEEKRESRTLA